MPFAVFGFWFSVKKTRVLNKLQVMLVALARERCTIPFFDSKETNYFINLLILQIFLT